MLDIIAERRSIRRYKDKKVERAAVEAIIKAGICAPSSKNRQPWKFVVAAEDTKEEALRYFQMGLEREKAEPLLPASAKHLAGAEHTLSIMRQAPVIIFIVNLLGMDLKRSLTPEERIYEICNAQSIGAAIENMTLTAAALGLGSLWICDTFFAQQELNRWLDTDGELTAALAVGYADEAPSARPRKSIYECVDWRI